MWAALTLAGILAIHGALFWLSHQPSPRLPFGDEVMYLRKATLMADGGPWTPARFWPLFHARFLAVILALGGGTLAIEIVQTAMLVLAALLVALLAGQLTGSRTAAWVAGALTLLDPQVGAFAHYYWPEIHHLLLFFGAWLILLRWPDRWGWLAAAGVLLALALLTKNHMSFFIPVLLLPLASGRGQPAPARLARAPLRVRAARVTVVVAALATTMIAANTLPRRPLAPHEQFVNCALFNIWVGLNDSARRDFVDEVVPGAMRAYQQSANSQQERNRILWRKIKHHVAERGMSGTLAAQIGRQFFRLFDKDSFMTDQLPGGRIVISRNKGYVQASPVLGRVLRDWSYLIYTAVLIAAAFGIAVLPPERRRWLWVVAAFFAYNLALFSIVHVKSRYRVQMMPMFYVYAGGAVAWARCRFGPTLAAGSPWRQPVTAWRWMLGALGAALWVYLAWGR